MLQALKTGLIDSLFFQDREHTHTNTHLDEHMSQHKTKCTDRYAFKFALHLHTHQDVYTGIKTIERFKYQGLPFILITVHLP